MRHGNAVRRLLTIAENCQQMNMLWKGEFVVAAYAFGSVLDTRADVPVVQVVFVLDLPADELTWGARPPQCAGLPRALDFDNAPVSWYVRPAVWPVANHLIQRPLRIWSLDGPDIAALDALERGEAEPLRLPAPTAETAREQLAEELAASLTYLRGVEEGYWEREWRRDHRGGGYYPEHHLWHAVHGYLDLLDASRPEAPPAG